MIKDSANVRNSIWNIINILVYPIAFLAATPLFISKLGESSFGVWMLVNSYVYIAVNIVGFGLPNSVIAHVAQSLGQKNSSTLHAYINAASRIFGRMSFFVLVAGLVGIVMLVLGFFPFEQDIWTLLILATFWISLKFPEVLYQSVFKGFERYDQSAIYNVLPRIITLVLQIILVLQGFGLREIFIANISVTFVFIVWQAIKVYQKLPGYNLILFKALKEREELYHFGFWTWMQTIIGVISFQMDRFIVAYFLGTATVAYYALAATMANHFHMAFEALVSWLFPKIARVKEQKKDIIEYFHTIRSFSVGTSLLAILIIYFLSEPVFLLWLGPDSFAKTIGFFHLFLIFEAFLILTIVPKLYLNGIKSLKFITLLEFMFKFLLIIGMLISFAIKPTAESLIWGQIIALIITMPIEYYLVNRKVLHENSVQETLLTILPSLFILAALLSANMLLTALAILSAAIVYWIYFVHAKKFNLKLLLE